MPNNPVYSDPLIIETDNGQASHNSQATQSQNVDAASQQQAAGAVAQTNQNQAPAQSANNTEQQAKKSSADNSNGANNANPMVDALREAMQPKARYEYPDEDEQDKKFWQRCLMRATKGGIDHRILKKVNGPRSFLVAVKEHTDGIRERKKAGIVDTVLDELNKLADQKPLLVLGYLLGLMLRYLLDTRFTEERLEKAVNDVSDLLDKQDKSKQERIEITPVADAAPQEPTISTAAVAPVLSSPPALASSASASSPVPDNRVVVEPVYETLNTPHYDEPRRTATVNNEQEITYDASNSPHAQLEGLYAGINPSPSDEEHVTYSQVQPKPLTEILRPSKNSHDQDVGPANKK